VDYYASALEGTFENDSQEYGYTYKKDGDYAYTLTMTKEQQQRKLEDTAQMIAEVFNDLVANGEESGVEMLEWNDDFSEVNLYVNEAVFGDENNVIATNALIATFHISPLYQVFQGKAKNAKSTVYKIDSETGDLLAMAVSPDEIFLDWRK
jgi:hypothetical protein